MVVSLLKSNSVLKNGTKFLISIDYDKLQNKFTNTLAFLVVFNFYLPHLFSVFTVNII
ncbi:hypothetical protein J2X32_003116 [Rheinheimera pacifica]|nr:hypothetical protein [Rheinheimera pacifica]